MGNTAIERRKEESFKTLDRILVGSIHAIRLIDEGDYRKIQETVKRRLNDEKYLAENGFDPKNPDVETLTIATYLDYRKGGLD